MKVILDRFYQHVFALYESKKGWPESQANGRYGHFTAGVRAVK